MKKNLLSLLLLILITNSTFAATWFVRSGGTGNGTTVDSPFGTITAAVNAAANGDIIDIGPGVFAERLAINKSLEIRGANADTAPWNWSQPATTIVPPSTNFEAGAPSTLAFVTTSGVKINGIEFDGANSSLSDAPPRTINGVASRANNGIAVSSATHNNFQFLNNRFRNLSARGIVVGATEIQTGLLRVQNNMFENITGVNNGLGIAVLITNQVPEVIGNRVANSNFGVLVQYSGTPSVSGTTTVVANTIEAHVVGLAVRGFNQGISPSLSIQDNSIARINYDLWSADGLTKPAGVEFTGMDMFNLAGSNPITIEQNVIRDARSAMYFLNVPQNPTNLERVVVKQNLVRNSRFGLYMDNASAASTRVVVEGGNYRDGVVAGMQVMGQGDFENTLVLRNGVVIEHPSQDLGEYNNGIILIGPKAVLAELNDTKIGSAKHNFIVFDQNAMAGKVVDGSNVTYDGTVNGMTFNNYKPSANPNNALRAAVLDRIYDGRDPGNTGSGIVQIAAVPNSTWYVRVNGNGNGATAESPFGSINTAIDAASDGDLIDIGSGVFAERFTINKSLELRGANQGTAPWAWTQAATTIIPPSTNFEAGAPSTLAYITASGVKIKGIEFDGANNSLSDAPARTINGVGARASNAIVVPSAAHVDFLFENNRIKNFSGRGVVVAAGAMQTTPLFVRNNAFDNITGVNNNLGIAVLVTNYLPQVTGNRITNSNFGVLLQYSGTPETTGMANLSNNTINAHVVGLAVRGFSNAIVPGVLVQLNTISGIDYANWSADGLTKPATVEFTGLDFENLLGNSGLSITANEVSGARSAVYFLNVRKSDSNPDRVNVANNLLKDSQGGIYIDNASTGDTRVVVSGTTVRNSTRVGMQVMGEGAFVNELVLRNGVLIEHPAPITTNYNDAIFLTGEKAVLSELNDTKISTVKYNFITFHNNAMAGREVSGNDVTYDGEVNGFTFNNYKPSATSNATLRTAVKDRINDGEDPNYGGSGIVRIATVTGVKDLEQYARVKVYPNPASNGYINVELTQAKGKQLTATLISLTGQKVAKKSVAIAAGGASLQISTSGLAKGVYLLQVNDNNATSTRKIIIE